MIVALVSDVFHDPTGPARLDARLAEARARGAELAVLPELPLNPWSPATRNVREDDAEAPGGPRHTILSQAAARAGIALIGGAIVRVPETGARHNTALVFDAGGTLVARYAKVHLPEEEGFWETSHYVPGTTAAGVIDTFGVPLGLQLCSDINRPIGSFTLAARGAEAIVNPRATEAGTWERWKLVFRATALTASAYVLSVNRPGPEFGVPLGGPSIVVGPDGNVIVEATDPLVVATLERDRVRQSRRTYPGYLPYFPQLYGEGWRGPSDRDSR